MGRSKFCRNYTFEYEFRGQRATMVMTSVIGHVLRADFGPEYSDWQRVPVEQLFSAPIVVEVDDGKMDVVENLRVEARKSQVLIIWTDCDREGEYIGSEVSKICLGANSRLDVHRARYSVLSRPELDRSIKNLARLDLRQVAAAELRSELDLRSGVVFTRLQTLHFRTRQRELDKKVVSYGSCQFPTLGFVVEQYLKVLNFVPEDFWSIQMQVQRSGRITKFSWKRNRLFDRLVCTILFERCVEVGKAIISKIESKPTSKWRPLPLRTVELQKFGSRFLKMSSDKVMDIAEKLYNQGFISYPRTETDMFEDGFDLHSLIAKQGPHPKWGSYVQRLTNGEFKFPRKGKNNDKAHPPIHPTKDGSNLQGAEAKLFEFVTRRFLACCSDDAKGLETVVLAKIGDEEFRARGIMVEALNYLEVYIYENWSDQEIGSFQLGEEIVPSRLEMTFGVTSAPKLLSESDLIGTMDKNGIGTDATIHEHIKKIIERSYVVKNCEARFHPTNLGLALVIGYDRVGLEESLTKPKLRALLESNMVAICRGQKSKVEVLDSMIELFRASLAITQSKMNVLYQAIEDNKNQGLFQPAPLDEVVVPSRAPPTRTLNNGGDTNNYGGNDGYKSDSSDDDQPAITNSKFINKPRPPPTSKSDNVYGPPCNCGKPSQSNITKKAGPNFGRSFWSCKICNFFAWVGDEQNTAPGRNDNTKSFKFPEETITQFNCDCGDSAVSRVVSKEGPNFGRPFATCGRPKGNSCTFFSWLDESSTSARATGKFGHAVKCECNMLAVREEAKSSGPNLGRVYYRCSKTVKKCRFFQWDDDDHSHSNVGSATRLENGDSLLAPQPSSISCYRCGGQGHFANTCTFKPGTMMDSNISPKRTFKGKGATQGQGGRGRIIQKRRKIFPSKS